MTEFIITLSIVFIAAGMFLLVANQLGLPAVPFYIIAGVFAGLAIDEAVLLELALWGIAFLVFVFGIQVDIGDLQSVLRDGEAAALTQLLVVAPIAFVVGYTISVFFGFEGPMRNAIYFSAAATLSSTLVGAQILEAEIRNNLVYGRLASSIHFFDDMVAIAVLLILSAETLTDSQLITSQIGYGVLFLIAGLLIYRHGYPLLIRAAGGGDELVLMGSISILIAFLAAAEFAGISIVVGAFAAGIAIRGDGAASIGVHNGIESIRDFFAAIFFVTVGALVAIPSPETLVFTVTLLVLVVVVNPIVHTLAFLYEGYDGRTAFLAGSSLNQVSELSLVIAIQALLMGTITGDLFDAIILAAAITMVLSTVTGRFENAFYTGVITRLFGHRTGYIDDHSQVDPELSDHVVLIGYGRLGRRIAHELDRLEQPYVAIENDPLLEDRLRRDSDQYVFGDAMATYPQELAAIESAKLVISTASYRPLSDALLEANTDADVVLRAEGSLEARELLDAGAVYVSVANVLASDQLVENVSRVLSGELEPTDLEDNHRQYLQALELLQTEIQ